MASYVASQGVAEEAEVVVVKPQVRHGAAKRPEGAAATLPEGLDGRLSAPLLSGLAL